MPAVGALPSGMKGLGRTAVAFILAVKETKVLLTHRDRTTHEVVEAYHIAKLGKMRVRQPSIILPLISAVIAYLIILLLFV